VGTVTPRIIGVISGKGGVGKTTTAVALAAAAQASGKRTLLVDTDPQGGASFACGIDPGALMESRTILPVLAGADTGDQAAVRVAEGFALLAAPPRLGFLFDGSRDRSILAALRRSSFEVIIIDSAPGFGSLVQAAVTVADQVLLAVLAEPLAVRGAEQSLGLLHGLEAAHKLAGIVLTMYQARLALTRDQEAEVARYGPIIATIPRGVAAAEAGLAKRSVLAYAPRSAAAQAYGMLSSTLAL
jgi:chromosome partitioning protein